MVNAVFNAAGWIQSQFDVGAISPDVSPENLARLVLGAAGDLASTPILSEETLPHLFSGALVRCRGMVQDMLNPEYHHTGLVTPAGRWLNGRFVDRPGEGGALEASHEAMAVEGTAGAPTCGAAAAAAALSAASHAAHAAPVPCGLSPDVPPPIEERRPLVVIPPPGESAWLSAALERRARASMPGLPRKRNAGESASSKGSGKRERDEAMAEGDAEASRQGSAKTASEGDGADATGAGEARPGGQGDKRARAPGAEGVEGAEDASSSVPCARSYDPLSPPPPGSAMVFVPGCEEGSARLNALIECVGILSLVPELGAVPPPSGEDPWATELAASRLPTSQVPRVHALTLEAVKEAHEVEELARAEACAGRAVALPPPADPRGAALELLADALGGDALAAELTLLQLVAKEVPAARGGAAAEDAPAIGSRVLWLDVEKLVRQTAGGADVEAPSASTAAASASVSAPAATITAVSAAAPAAADAPALSRLLSALASLAPRVVRIACDVPSLNGSPLWPRRDPASARLQRSPLQVASGTVMVLDETRLEAGRLGDSGVKNLAALRDVASRRKAPYEFEVFSMDLPVHAAVVVVTKGSSGLLGEAAGTKPLAVLPAASPRRARAASGATLVAVRSYLAHCRTLDARIAPACAASIEADLAAARSRNRELSQDDMHDWLNLARLLAVSRGEPELSEERWKEAGALRDRIQRRAAPPAQIDEAAKA